MNVEQMYLREIDGSVYISNVSYISTYLLLGLGSLFSFYSFFRPCTLNYVIVWCWLRTHEQWLSNDFIVATDLTLPRVLLYNMRSVSCLPVYLFALFIGLDYVITSVWTLSSGFLDYFCLYMSFYATCFVFT